MSHPQQPRVKVTYGRKNRRSVAATPDSRVAAFDAVSSATSFPDGSDRDSVVNVDRSDQIVSRLEEHPPVSSAPAASTSTSVPVNLDAQQSSAPLANLIADDGTSTPIPSPPSQPAAKRPKMVHRMSSRSSASASPEKARARDTSASPRKLTKTTSLPLTSDASRSPSPSKDKSQVRKGASLPSLDQNSLPPSPAKRRLFADQLDVPAASSAASSKLKHTYGKAAAQQTKGDDEAALLEPLPVASTSTSQAPKSGSSTLQTYLKTRDSYRDMRKRLGVDDSSDEDDGDRNAEHPAASSEHSNATRSKRKRIKRIDANAAAPLNSGPSQLQGITALRTQGQRKQFEDELSYVLEGLQGNEGDQPSVALRRSTAMDLLQRLKEDASDFTRAVRTFGAWPRLASALLGAIPPTGVRRDALLEACFAFFVLLCAQDQRDAESLFAPSAPDIVSRLLESASGPFARAVLSANSSHFRSSQDKKAAERFCALTCGEDVKLWHLELYKPKEMTPERLVVCAIQRLCDLGPLGFSEVLACGSGSDMVGSIEDILQRELSTCSEWSAQMGKTVVDEEKCKKLTFIEKCLQIEEYALQAGLESSSNVSLHRRPLIMERLVAFIWCCHLLTSSEDPVVLTIALSCQVIGLKVIIALSASSENCTAALADQYDTARVLGVLLSSSTDIQHRVQEGEAKEAVTQLSSDVVCLLLAIFTLLVEFDPKRFKNELRTSLFGVGSASDCLSEGSCEALKRISILEILSAVYSQQSTSTEGSDDAMFIRDYTSLLLGTLMVDCEANEDKVHEYLSKTPRAMEAMKTALLAYGSQGDNADAHTSAAIQAIVSRWS